MLLVPTSFPLSLINYLFLILYSHRLILGFEIIYRIVSTSLSIWHSFFYNKHQYSPLHLLGTLKTCGYWDKCNHFFYCLLFYTVVDRCDPNPCQNGAICTNLGTSFQCQCLDGFTGTLCDNGKDYFSLAGAMGGNSDFSPNSQHYYTGTSSHNSKKYFFPHKSRPMCA